MLLRFVVLALFSPLFAWSAADGVRTPDRVESIQEVPQQDQVTIETDQLKMIVDLRGGDVLDLRLLQQQTSAEIKAPLRMLSCEKDFKYLLKIGVISSLPTLSEAASVRILYRCDHDSYVMGDQEHLSVRLHAQVCTEAGQPIDLVKVFHFKKGSYLFETEYSIHNQTDQAISCGAFAQFVFTCNAPRQKEDEKEHLRETPKIICSTRAKELSIHTPSYRGKLTAFEQSTDQGWVALVHQHFLSANCLVDAVPQTIYGYTDPNSQLLSLGSQTLLRSIEPGQQHSMRFRFYCGPMQRDLLEAASKHLGSTINSSGAFRWLTAPIFFPIFKLLQWLQRRFNSWGWAIVASAVLVQGVLLSPFSYRKALYDAQKKSLASDLKRLKEKYTDDPQGFRLAEEKFLAARKVRPCAFSLIFSGLAGGFLIWPILRNAYELRLVQFLWLPDLARPDPYQILFVCYLLLDTLQENLIQETSAWKDRLGGLFLKALMSYFIFARFAPSGGFLYTVIAQGIAFLQSAICQLWFQYYPPGIIVQRLAAE